MIHLRCMVPGCGFACDPAATNLRQYRALQDHYDAHFPPTRKAQDQMESKKNLGTGIDGLPGHPTPTSPSVLEQIWNELDRCIKTALEWPKVAEGVWDSESDEIAFLKNELAKTKAAAAGRGLAIAISKMQYASYPTDDDVMREAMARYEVSTAAPAAQETPQPVNPTPPTPAPGATTPVSPAPATMAQETAPAAPAPVAPAPAAPGAPTPGELAPEEVAAIQNALESGFDVDNLAIAFKIPVEQIRIIAEAVTS